MRKNERQGLNGLQNDHFPLFLSFLSIITFEEFHYNNEAITLTFRTKVEPELLDLYLKLLRRTTGNEFYFEIEEQSPCVTLKCLTNSHFFTQIKNLFETIP